MTVAEPKPSELGLRPHTLPALLALAVAVLIPGLSSASVATVPDDYSTIQAAIDIGADTVLVREGEYAEVPRAYRGVTLLGLGTARPRIAGLTITNPYGWLSRKWRISDVDIAGPVVMHTDNPSARLLDIAFDRCRLAQGLIHDAGDIYDIYTLSLTHCRLEGQSDGVAAVLKMHADTSTAGWSWNLDESASVDSSWFSGGVNQALRVGGNDQASASIVDNVMEYAPKGLLLSGFGDATVRSNVVRHASAIGMELDARWILIKDNDISDCGIGLWKEVSDGTTLIGNRIVRTANTGAQFNSPTLLQAEDNIIGHCGGSAIAVQFAPDAILRFAQNTLYAAAGSGILILDGDNAALTVEENIGYGITGFGLQVMSTTFRSTSLGRNDWSSNGLGAVYGVAAGATDLAVDPEFCDVAQDDVHLSALSPLLNAAGCGQVGALGQGCDTPIIARLTTFTAASATDGVEVRWQVADAAPGFVAWIERADAATGPWVKVEGESASEGDVTVDHDRTTEPARSYWYRLVATDRGTTRALGDAIRVETNPPTRFALLSTGANPSPGAFEATFQLAHAADITLELFDTQGRRVATLARGTWTAGIHRAGWSGAGGTAPGLYMLRFRYPGGENLRRIAIVR